MSSVEELLARLDAAGLTLRRDGGRMVLGGATAAAPPELLEELKARKAELLEFFREPWPPPAGAFRRCPGFRAKAGKDKRPIYVKCGALFLDAADCAEACLNRYCPQKREAEDYG